MRLCSPGAHLRLQQVQKRRRTRKYLQLWHSFHFYQVKEQESRVEEQEAEIEAYTKKSDNARADVTTMTNEASLLMQRIESLTGQYEQQVAENERKHARGVELKQELHRLESSKIELSNSLGELEIEKLSHTTALQDLQAKKIQMETEASKRTAEMTDLRKRHEDLRNQIEQDQAKVLSAEILELERKRTSIWTQVDDLDRDLSSKKVELAAAKGDFEDLSRKRTQLKEDLTKKQQAADIKCKNVWVWKNSCLSCLSGMTLKSVMHITKEPHFSVMQRRSLSCRIGKT